MIINVLLVQGLRNIHGICPPDVVRFLLDLFKYNDNSKNHFSDNYYKASLVDALAATITPVISVMQPVSSVIFCFTFLEFEHTNECVWMHHMTKKRIHIMYIRFRINEH